MRGGVEPDTVYSATSHCATTEVGEEMILLHLQNGTYYGLDEAGSYIWSILKEGATFSQMLQKMQNKYSVDQSVLERDLQKLLAGLLEHELVEKTEPGTNV